jgi:hypothetical protein
MVGMVNCFLVYAALAIMVYGRLKGSMFYYGKFFMEDGICPVAIHGGCEEVSFVGCGPKFDNPTPLDVNGMERNYIAWSEAIMGSLMFFLGIPILAAAILLIFMIFRTFARLLKFASNLASGGRRNANSDLLSPKEVLEKKLKNEKTLAGFGAFALIVIAAFAVVSIPINYFQTVKPKSFTIIDGGGPLKMTHLTGYYQLPDGSVGWRNYTAENGSSWNDCFTIKPVHDKMGFVGIWWDEQKKHVENILAVV